MGGLEAGEWRKSPEIGSRKRLEPGSDALPNSKTGLRPACPVLSGRLPPVPWADSSRGFAVIGRLRRSADCWGLATRRTPLLS